MNIYKVIITIGFFFPFLYNFTNSFRISQVGYSVLLFLTILYQVLKKNLLFRNNGLLKMSFIFFFIFLFMGIALGGEFLRSLSDSSRYLFFSLFLAFGIIVREKIPEDYIEKIIEYSLIVSLIITIGSYISIFYPIVDFFKGRQSTDPLYFHFIRASGLFAFPSDLGSFCSFTFVLYTLKSNKSNGKKHFIFIILSVLLIFLGASRSGILQLSTAYVFLCLKMRKIFFPKTLLALGLIGITVLSVYEIDSILLKYISVDFSNVDESILHRFKELEYSMNVLREKYFLWGPERVNPYGLPVIEGFLTNLILKFSYLGVFFWVGMSMIAIQLFNKASHVLSISTAIWFITFVLFLGFFSDVLFRFKGNFIWPFLLGFTFNNNKYFIKENGAN